MKMETLEIEDIQGLLIRGYKELPSASFLLCHSPNKQSLKDFLKYIIIMVTNGTSDPKTKAINITITKEGVELLAQPMQKDFSIEFREGMVSPFRQRILGDYNKNSPEKWNWGKPEDKTIHFMLMCYATTPANLQAEFKDIDSKLAQLGIIVLRKLPSQKLVNDREHFGFHDGVSQPTLSGLQHKRQDNPHNIVASGEFIFGYPNEYNKLPVSPTLADGFDLGKNGAYMVFRQIDQDVKGFWNYMMKKSNNEAEAIQLASSMVGRYPTGTPLVLSPGHDSKKKELFDTNDFGYYNQDLSGQKCPIGAHIRKANPRDGMNDDPEESIMVSKRHRILRRGRPYGDPLASSMAPEDIISAEENKNAVGLYFICFNTNIGRQFEFIQQQWMNNKKFDHLYNDPDPLIGIDGKPPAHGMEKPDQLGEFTVQACPVRRKLTDVPQFTFVKGGAYFFMPGIKALHKLAE